LSQEELDRIREALGWGADESLWPPGLILSESVARLVSGLPFTYRQARSWPRIPVPEVEREEIETMYSLTHWDGPWSGLVRWRERVYFVEAFEQGGDRNFWLVELPEEEAAALVRRAELWAERFSSSMTWNANGTRVPFRDGNARQVWGDHPDHWHRFFEKEAGPLSIPEEAPVIGYFREWSL
jgi:hypothetical protein